MILAIDGRKPEDGAHALRILRSYKPGEKLNLVVLRQRKALTLAVTMPERPEFDDDMDTSRCRPMPPVPPVPPAPPSGCPAGAGHRRRERVAAMAVNSPPCAAPTSTTNFPKT